MKKELKVPTFKNEGEEYDFWSNLNLSEYFEPSDFKPLNIVELLEKSKLKTRKMTIRIPEQWIVEAKLIAGQLDISYQALLKQFIHQGLRGIRNRNVQK